MSAITWIGIALLGGVGAVARLLIGSAVTARLMRRGRPAWGVIPAGTFAVNISGSLLLGLLAGLGGASGHVPAVLGLGLLGSYTTFSTGMVESAVLAEDGRKGAAGLYLAISLAAGLGALTLGHLIGTTLG